MRTGLPVAKVLCVLVAVLAGGVILNSSAATFVAVKVFAGNVEDGLFDKPPCSPVIVLLLLFSTLLALVGIVWTCSAGLRSNRWPWPVATILALTVATCLVFGLTAWQMDHAPGGRVRIEFPLAKPGADGVFECLDALPVHVRYTGQTVVVFPKLSDELVDSVRQRLRDRGYLQDPTTRSSTGE